MKPAKFLIIPLISFLLFQSTSTVNSGTADIATLTPSSAIILTGTVQPLSFSATNDKTFNIKTYHAEFSFTPGLIIT